MTADGKKRLEELVARTAHLPGQVTARVDCDDLRSISDAYKAMEAENERLREILSKCATALGNGAHIDPGCTVEFMSELPHEIELRIAALRPAILEEAVAKVQHRHDAISNTEACRACCRNVIRDLRALAHTTGQEG